MLGRNFSLYFLCLYLIAACSGTKAIQTTPPQAENKEAQVWADPGTAVRPTPSSQGQEICKTFFDTVKVALTIHLKRKISDADTLLDKSYQIVLNEIEQKNPELKSRVNEVRASNHLSLDNCAPIVALANAIGYVKEPQNTFLRHTQHLLTHFASELDSYSSYDSPEDLEDQSSIQSKGAGIRLYYRSEFWKWKTRSIPYFVVDGFFPGSLNKGALKKGDYLYVIDGKKASELNYYEADGLLNSTNKSELDVSLTADGSKRVHLRTGDITKSFADATIVGDPKLGIVHLRIRTFLNDNVASLLKSEWIRVTKQLGDLKLSVHGLILDLRGNGGGVIRQAAEIIAPFLGDQSIPIFYAHATTSNSREVSANDFGKPTKLALALSIPQQFDIDGPTVVLIERISASASEAVTAALQDYRRALVIGEMSFGKGIGQSGFKVPQPLGGAIYITNETIFRPNGSSFQLVGISPDVLLQDPVLTAMNKGDPSLLPRMADKKKMPGGDLIFDTPQSLKSSDFKLKAPTIPAAVSSEVLKEMRALKLPLAPVCSHVPGDPVFKETDDCLLEMGYQYTRRFIQALHDEHSIATR